MAGGRETDPTRRSLAVDWLVLSQIQNPTSLNFLKFFGTLYGLDIVKIGSLHLEGVQWVPRKIKI